MARVHGSAVGVSVCGSSASFRISAWGRLAEERFGGLLQTPLARGEGWARRMLLEAHVPQPAHLLVELGHRPGAWWQMGAGGGDTHTLKSHTESQIHGGLSRNSKHTHTKAWTLYEHHAHLPAILAKSGERWLLSKPVARARFELLRRSVLLVTEKVCSRQWPQSRAAELSERGRPCSAVRLWIHATFATRFYRFVYLFVYLFICFPYVYLAIRDVVSLMALLNPFHKTNY